MIVANSNGSAGDETALLQEAALQAADPRLLAAILVQLSGDRRWIAEPFRSSFSLPPKGAAKAPSEAEVAETERLKESLRSALAAELGKQRDGSLPVPNDDVLRDLVEFVTGEPLAPSYAALLRESLAGPAPRASVSKGQAIPSIVIIGAGLCGLSMAIRLRELGVPFKILEKHHEPGGVWLENSYPGCAVDSPNHAYSFSSDLNPDWTRFFAARDEILAYIRDAVTKFEIAEDIEFGTEVRSMTWSDAKRQWIIEVSTATGSAVRTCDVVITALGTLNQPKFPEIESIETFSGEVFHTARWRDEVELSGRRIGLIGNGSSGFQVGPYLAKVADRLTSFQRSPAWTAPNPLATAPVPAELRWLLRHVPGYAEWHRFALYYSSGDQGFSNLVIDPEWKGPGISEANERIRHGLADYIRSQLGERPDLCQKLIPDYPPFTKRMVVDNGWLKCFTEPGVRLVSDEIVRATPDGLITADGTHHDLDVIVVATGFHATRFLWPTEVRGRSGRTPAEIAGRNDDIRAYLGIVMPDFPNLFSLYGPNSSIGHGGSAIHIAECQAHYISECIALMMDRGVATLECSSDVCAEYNRSLDLHLDTMVWSEPGVASRYRNAAGRIVANHPWTLQQYWEMTRKPDFDEFELEYRE